MQKWLVSVVILSLSFVAIGHAQRGRGAGPGGPPPPPRPVAGNGVEVPGWWGRLDDVKEPMTGLKFAPMNGGLHATTGPNIIFWDPQQVAMGNYTVKATFSVTKQPSHEVSYGLFIGGDNLDGDKQKSTRLNSSHLGISYAVFCLKKIISNNVNNKHKKSKKT